MVVNTSHKAARSIFGHARGEKDMAIPTPPKRGLHDLNQDVAASKLEVDTHFHEKLR